jgi:hypothetical protein
MYSLSTPERVFPGLTADDVNMVRMGMSGENRLEGDADDYTVVLQYQNDCSGAAIRVAFKDFGGETPTGNARCGATIQRSFGQGPVAVHYTMVASIGSFLQVELDHSASWDYGDRFFESGFEPGDTREWSSVFP